MNIFKLAFELFVIYMLYKLVFDFIIPVYNTTRQMKQKMGEMHRKMQEQETSEQIHKTAVRPPENPAQRSYKDDYIDYEEIK